MWVNVLITWRTDPLRSIGATFPFFALLGVLAAWRRIGWQLEGTSWGLLLVALSLPLARVSSVARFLIFQTFGLLHPGPVLLLYAIGAVLLFGGPRLLRYCIVPLCLLLFIDPVPYAFNAFVDLPLQHLGADTARAFAHLIGLHPTGEQLRMLFAPNFGMMIVPGCNGVRGSVTLGYLAIIFAYTRRLRPRLIALIAFCSFLLGYVLNLARLCLLVIYYRIGVSFPQYQRHGTGLDYIIGCVLFLGATLCIGVVIRLLEPPQPAPPPEPVRPISRSAFYANAARASAFLVVILAILIPTFHYVRLQDTTPSEAQLIASFPADVGPWRLIRTYTEHNSTGLVVLGMAEYAPPASFGPGRNLTFGLWVDSGFHYVAISKYIQGAQVTTTGSFDAQAAASLPIHFVTSLYDDGTSVRDDAETTCSPGSCSSHLYGATGVLSVAPAWRDMVFPPGGTRLPVLIRREWLETTAADNSVQRAQFESDARLFAAQLDLRRLLAQDGTKPDR